MFVFFPPSQQTFHLFADYPTSQCLTSSAWPPLVHLFFWLGEGSLLNHPHSNLVHWISNSLTPVGKLVPQGPLITYPTWQQLKLVMPNKITKSVPHIVNLRISTTGRRRSTLLTLYPHRVAHRLAHGRSLGEIC